MYDKDKLDLLLEALGSLATANDLIERVAFAELVEPVKKLSDLVDKHLNVLAQAEAAQKALEKAAAEEAAAAKAAELDEELSGELNKLISTIDVKYFLWKRGKSLFITFVCQTENSDIAAAVFADLEGWFDHETSYPIAERWEGEQYYYMLFPINLVPNHFKHGMPKFQKFGAAMEYDRMYESGN